MQIGSMRASDSVATLAEEAVGERGEHDSRQVVRTVDVDVVVGVLEPMDPSVRKKRGGTGDAFPLQRDTLGVAASRRTEQDG